MGLITKKDSWEVSGGNGDYDTYEEAVAVAILAYLPEHVSSVFSSSDISYYDLVKAFRELLGSEIFIQLVLGYNKYNKEATDGAPTFSLNR